MSDPTLLLPYQQRWVADPSPLKVCEKGRRTGITWAEASDDVLIASSARGAGGSNVYYFPQAKEDAVEYIETCGKWARAFQRATSEIVEASWEQELGEVLDADDPDKVIRTYKIEFASGYRIVALSSAPARARGKQGVFVLDEAAFHPNLPGVLKAVMAAYLRGGKIRVISTHNGDLNAFNELITEIRAGKRLGTVHRYPFRLAIAEGMYRRICETEGEPWTQAKEDEYVRTAYGLYGDDAAEELDAIPAEGEGAFLSRALIERAMREEIPVVRWAVDDAFVHQPARVREADCAEWCERELGPLLAELDPNLHHYFGSDFGRSVDLSTIWPVAETRLLKLETPFLVELRNIPFEQQRQIVFYLVDRLPRFLAGAMDARGNGQYLAEVTMQRYGSRRIEMVMLTSEWYREHMPPFKAAFEDQILTAPRDADVLRDLRAIQVLQGVPRVPETARFDGADGKPRHADAAIAALLAHYAVRGMPHALIEYEAIPPKAGRWDAIEEDDFYGRADEDSITASPGCW